MKEKIKVSDNMDAERISHQYEYSMEDGEKKKTGSFYTDRSIIKYMLGAAIDGQDIIKNPYIRILDPSCGCGYFLIEMYDFLNNVYRENLNYINSIHPDLKLEYNEVHDHILKHNLFGSDIDPEAVKITILGLMQKNADRNTMPNIICCDSLMDWENTYLFESDFWRDGFDIIIGNPPYIGHKSLTGSYRKTLNGIYGDIFKDKADISFCFIKSSIDRLNIGGRLCFITSRYFLESPNGRVLRDFIKEVTEINSIIDFYGIRVMKGISVDPAIIFLKKARQFDKNKIKVFKAKGSLKSLRTEDVFRQIENPEYFDVFEVPQGSLKDEGWTLCKPSAMTIIDKIEKKTVYRLSDICISFQGIITGCDRAFVMKGEDIKVHRIEECLVKPWIKSTGIHKYRVQNGDLYLIYSDIIEDTEKYKNALSWIANYRDRLENRRECRRGVREWYQLQWGRDRTLFDRKKIVFPYKSGSNRFAIDSGNYCSADVYGMYIKEDKKNISYEFLLGVLNSKLYEFYFKSYGKKLGDDLYDYYPNTVMRLMIPETDSFIESTVKYIIDNDDDKSLSGKKREIDRRMYDIFGLDSNEISIVEGRSQI